MRRANYNYELSLFVVKNLCYIFMLTHSLYPSVATLAKRILFKRHLLRQQFSSPSPTNNANIINNNHTSDLANTCYDDRADDVNGAESIQLSSVGSSPPARGESKLPTVYA